MKPDSTLVGPETAARGFPGDGLAKLRVRVTKASDYRLPFVADFGQRNAVLVKRPLTPLKRFFSWADALAPLPGPGYDIIHSLNAVPVLTRRPYVVSFESYLPRVPEDRHVGWLERWLQRRLLRDQCVALIAWSEYARRQFRWQNRHFAGRERLEAKMELLYLPIRRRLDRPKQPSAKLRLLFVGRDFMRKGMPAAVRAHERLRREGVPVETTLVSSLRWRPDDYVGPPSAALIDAEVRRLDQPGIEHHRNLSGAAVRDLMAKADYLAFPTLHDTFGLVALEALASGTPVIATATGALPEIVEHGRSGYLLPLDNDPDVGKWVGLSRRHQPGYLDAYVATIERLSEALAERLLACWESRQDYQELSAGALARVRERFDLDRARDRLEVLYERCRERIPPPRGVRLRTPLPTTRRQGSQAQRASD